MSNALNPTLLLLLERLAAASRDAASLWLEAHEIAWILAQLKHKDDQIAALAKLARPSPAAVAAEPTETICQEADRIVSLDRQHSYGNPRDDFTRTAAMWEPLLGLPPGAISPEKVGMCMIALKLSRLCHGYKRDTLVDIAGYAKTIDLCHQEAAG